MECIKVYDVKLADVNRLCSAIRVGLPRWEKVLPTPFQDAHTWPVIPTSVSHLFQTRWMALDDDMLSGLGVLEIRVDLCSTNEEEYTNESEVDTHHSNTKSNVEDAEARDWHPFQEKTGSFTHLSI